MSTTRTRSRSRARRIDAIQKPRGVIHPRVQKVGPEHFGIVSVDCAKARSKWMLCDFYGKVLVPPTEVEHNQAALETAIARVRQAMTQHDLKDLLVAVERTGNYHRVVQHAFGAAGFEARIVHPFATKQYRQANDPGNKTDDTDLAAIQRAAVSGFALLEAPLDVSWKTLRLLVRQRRDLVGKTSALCCQIREHLEAALPGFAACFNKLWESPLPWHLLECYGSAQALASAGLPGLSQSLQQAHIRFQQRSLSAVLGWAAQAAAGDLAAGQHRRIALALNGDRLRKTQEIHVLEKEIAHLLVTTPYILLLTFPGVNVVSAADFAAEMGPIAHYANSRAITGRAGLRPSRYQSDQVDHANGPLVRCCNRKLRAAILGIANNLIKCNHHFNVLSHRWKALGKDPRHTRVKVGSRFCRIAFVMVAGGQVFRHPGLQDRHYLLHKLTAFHTDHDTLAPDMLRDLQAAIEQLPKTEYRAEAKLLADELQKIQNSKRRGPQILADILPIVLARLGVGALQSTESGEPNPS
jgi:transposase